MTPMAVRQLQELRRQLFPQPTEEVTTRINDAISPAA